MISLRIRVAAAIAAAVLFAGACWLLIRTQRPLAALLFAPAALLSLPLFASNRPPRVDESESLDESVTRFRTAGLACFTMAVLAHAAATVLRLGAHAADSVAAFGVAWWAVGFSLIPFALYFASRRAMLEDDSAD